MLTQFSLFVSLATVSHSYNIDNFVFAVNGIDNAIISNPDSPEVFLALQFATTPWGRFLGESLYF
jgi:hypothetical protein